MLKESNKMKTNQEQKNHNAATINLKQYIARNKLYGEEKIEIVLMETINKDTGKPYFDKVEKKYVDNLLTNIEKITTMKEVATLSSDTFTKEFYSKTNEKKIINTFYDFYKMNRNCEVKEFSTNAKKQEFEIKIDKQEIGKIAISKSGITNSLDHTNLERGGYYNKDFINVFQAVPNIIKEGVIVKHNYHHKDRGQNYNTYTICAPVNIGKKELIGEVVISEDKKDINNNKNTFNLHKVILKDNLLKEKNNLTDISVERIVTAQSKAAGNIVSNKNKMSKENLLKKGFTDLGARDLPTQSKTDNAILFNKNNLSKEKTALADISVERIVTAQSKAGDSILLSFTQSVNKFNSLPPFHKSILTTTLKEYNNEIAKGNNIENTITLNLNQQREQLKPLTSFLELVNNTQNRYLQQGLKIPTINNQKDLIKANRYVSYMEQADRKLKESRIRQQSNNICSNNKTSNDNAKTNANSNNNNNTIATKTKSTKDFGLLIFIICCYCCLFLSSCSPTSSSWSCKGNLKGGCRTIGEIDNNSESIANIKPKDNEKKQDDVSFTDLSDYRSKEQVARVMFAPYVDKAGNRHDKSIVYYLEQKAEWKK